MLKNKKILLGVCGSIAAYKSAGLTRLLIKEEAEVKIIMTPDALNFITPLTLSTLSKNPVLLNYFKENTGEWNNHVELGLWADIMLVAPLSANTLSKFATGLCDNLLSAIYLSARCPVILAPAMDMDMLHHPSTQKNIKTLKEFGNTIIKPGFGELASGLNGEGRMAEPEEIVKFLNDTIYNTKPLSGKKALVTAGPTYEAIDPVRFVGNHSSGKMGFAIAEELARLGASVTLITGPVSLNIQNSSIKRIDITTAEEMFEAVSKSFNESNITIMSAAVADYKIDSPSLLKIKKAVLNFDLHFTKTIDVLTTLGKQKTKDQILVGFALETNNEEENAIKKLTSKNLDFIVLNSLNDKGAGFKSDYNKVTIIDKQLNKDVFNLKSKNEVATDICRKIIELIK